MIDGAKAQLGAYPFAAEFHVPDDAYPISISDEPQNVQFPVTGAVRETFGFDAHIALRGEGGDLPSFTGIEDNWRVQNGDGLFGVRGNKWEWLIGPERFSIGKFNRSFAATNIDQSHLSRQALSFDERRKISAVHYSFEGGGLPHENIPDLNLWRMRRNKFVTSEVNGSFKLNALPNSNASQDKSKQGNRSGPTNDPQIGRRFFLAVCGLLCCFGFGLWGWDNFYKGRRLFGAALVGSSWLLGGLGLLIWLGRLL